MTEITNAAQKVLELAGNLSLVVMVPTIGIFTWSLLFKVDKDEDWTTNLAVSLKIGGVFLLLAFSILLNAAGSEIWFVMRVERLWGLYVVLLLAGTIPVFLVSWIKGQRRGGIQSLYGVASEDNEAKSRVNWMPVGVSISLIIAWFVAVVWLWSISKSA